MELGVVLGKPETGVQDVHNPRRLEADGSEKKQGSENFHRNEIRRARSLSLLYVKQCSSPIDPPVYVKTEWSSRLASLCDTLAID